MSVGHLITVNLTDLPEKYFFCDPASGKQPIKKSRGRSAIVGIGADSIERIFTLVAWASRGTTDMLIDKILAVNEEWKPRIFGIEANAMQSLFADALRREITRRHLRVPLVPVYQPTGIDKDFRIRSVVQPAYAEGRLFVQAGQHDLLNEITSFPTGSTKDLVDALASAISLVPARSTRAQRDDETDARLAYLRDSGASPDYIETVAREAGRV